jgi:uncharacterized protein (TIGR02996 family)
MNAEAPLKAIIESPDDDAPRLAYANWLEERGDRERAEFIWVQLDLARLPEDAPSRNALERRERELLREHKHEWGASPWCRRLRRGFVESISLDLNTFLDHAEEIFTQLPVREVVVYDACEDNVPDLSTSPFLTRLSSLQVLGGNAGPLSDRDIIPLARSPYLGHLVSLDLSYNSIGDGFVQELASSLHLGRLETLNLGHNAIGSKGVEHLAFSPNLPRLSSLHLGSNSIGPAGIAALASSDARLSLVTLICYNNGIADEGAELLAGSANAETLIALNLGWNDIGDAGGTAMAASPHLPRLVQLDLEQNQLGEVVRYALQVRFGNHVHL